MRTAGCGPDEAFPLVDVDGGEPRGDGPEPHEVTLEDLSGMGGGWRGGGVGTKGGGGGSFLTTPHPLEEEVGAAFGGYN